MTGTKITKRSDQKEELRSALAAMAPQIEASLARQIDTAAFSRMALMAAETNPTLLQCAPRSLYACVLQAAQLRLPLDPTLGWAWIVPRKIKGELKAQFQLGYRGAIQLLYRSGMVKAVRSNVVREADDYHWKDGRDFELRHNPSADAEDSPVVAAWAIIETTDGGEIPAWLWEWELARLRKGRPKSGISDDQHWMDRKGAIVRAWKTGPCSIELQRALVLDEKSDAGVDQEIETSVDADFSVLGDEEEEPKTAAESFKEKHAPEKVTDDDAAVAKPEAADDDGRQFDSSPISKSSLARIRKHKKALGVSDERFGAALANLGVATLQELPAELEEDVITVIDHLAKRPSEVS